jgi:hypothetical protein
VSASKSFIGPPPKTGRKAAERRNFSNTRRKLSEQAAHFPSENYALFVCEPGREKHARTGPAERRGAAELQIAASMLQKEAPFCWMCSRVSRSQTAAQIGFHIVFTQTFH